MRVWNCFQNNLHACTNGNRTQTADCLVVGPRDIIAVSSRSIDRDPDICMWTEDQNMEEDTFLEMYLSMWKSLFKLNLRPLEKTHS